MQKRRCAAVRINGSGIRLKEGQRDIPWTYKGGRGFRRLGLFTSLVTGDIEFPLVLEANLGSPLVA